MDLIKFSQFDSSILGQKVGKLSTVSSNNIPDVIKEIKSQQYDFISIFCPIDPSITTLLESSGFHFVSIRSTYATQIQAPFTSTNTKVVIKRINSANPLLSDYDISTISHIICTTSRYYKDPLILQPLAENIYQTWIRNSLFNNYADYIFAAYVDNNFAGWLSLKGENTTISIDLIGILDKYQNNGVGSALLTTALSSIPHTYNYISTITEGENIQAIKFYSKFGFQINKVELVYHYHSI